MRPAQVAWASGIDSRRTIARPCLADELLRPPSGELGERWARGSVKLPSHRSPTPGRATRSTRWRNRDSRDRTGARPASRWRSRSAAWSARPWSSSSSSSPNRCGSEKETASVPITSPSGPRRGAAATATQARGARRPTGRAGSCGMRGVDQVVLGRDDRRSRPAARPLMPSLTGKVSVDSQCLGPASMPSPTHHGRAAAPCPPGSISERCAPSEPMRRRGRLDHEVGAPRPARGWPRCGPRSRPGCAARRPRRASSSCDLASRSMRRWLAIAAAAWSARARRSATSASSKSSIFDEYAPRAPMHLALGDERRRGHRAHVRDVHDPVRDRRVLEPLVAPIVARRRASRRWPRRGRRGRPRSAATMSRMSCCASGLRMPASTANRMVSPSTR